MSCRSPRNVIVVIKPQGRFARRGQSLAIGREHRSVDRPHERLSVSLRVFTEREGEGS